MPPALDLRLDPEPDAPLRARTAAAAFLSGRRLAPERLSELLVIVSELVTNAIVHGRGRIELRLRMDGSLLLGEVVDEGPGIERRVERRDLRLPQPPAEAVKPGGFGLPLVAALSDRWGVHDGSSHVWFEAELGTVSDAAVEPPETGEAAKPDVLDEP